MTENGNTPTPENNPSNTQSYGSYGSQSGTSQNGGAYQQPYGAPTNGTSAGDPQQPGGKKPKNIVGIVALALSALGFVLGLFPVTALFGWLLLFAGFVTGIVGLFQKLKEKITSIIAIALSVVGTIASIIAMVAFAANTIANDPEFEQMIQDAQTSVSAAATPSASAAAEETSAADSNEQSAASLDGVLKFGETAEYNDGVKVTVSEPRTDYTPGDTAAGNDNDALKNYVVFAVTIENGSQEAYDPVMFLASGNSAGLEANQIFDSAQNLGSTPSTKLLPGDKVTFDMAFAVADVNDITLEISTDFEHDEILFTTKDI